MNCEELRELIGVHTDGELHPTEQRLVEQHASGCNNCQALIEDAQKLSSLIRNNSRFAMPPGLKASITETLDDADREPTPGVWYRQPTFFLTTAAAMAAGILATLLTFQLLEPRNGLTSDLVTAHLRHMLREEFGSVTSSDRHTIRPWFTGKIDYAAPVVDLAEAGYPLRAGRVEYIDGRAVAALTYGRRKHQITLFILPPEIKASNTSPGAASAVSARGFNIMTWQSQGFSFAAISDVNTDDLSVFADHIRAALGKG